MAVPSPVRRRELLQGGLAAAAALAGSRRPAAAATGGYRVVVHPARKIVALDRRFLSQAFLKKTSVWPDGVAIRAVDLPAQHPARRSFTEAVHGRSVAAVKSYWQQVIFSGRGVPPPELESEAAVLRFVAYHPGAIGYLGPDIDLRTSDGTSVRVVAVR